MFLSFLQWNIHLSVCLGWKIHLEVISSNPVPFHDVRGECPITEEEEEVVSDICQSVQCWRHTKMWNIFWKVENFPFKSVSITPSSPLPFQVSSPLSGGGVLSQQPVCPHASLPLHLNLSSELQLEATELLQDLTGRLGHMNLQSCTGKHQHHHIFITCSSHTEVESDVVSEVGIP